MVTNIIIFLMKAAILLGIKQTLGKDLAELTFADLIWWFSSREEASMWVGRFNLVTQLLSLRKGVNWTIKHWHHFEERTEGERELKMFLTLYFVFLLGNVDVTFLCSILSNHGVCWVNRTDTKGASSPHYPIEVLSLPHRDSVLDRLA